MVRQNYETSLQLLHNCSCFKIAVGDILGVKDMKVKKWRRKDLI
ncbi:hypothetical protein [Lachnospira multipara]|nr:hypothetical protein [Lachnospira multipara]